mmetsp:Transcript_67074/g.146273  ORF Transcript_67074/g.146273 Transcript_67074/m.146273 type:complete len:381 (+) Transcript_67074:43-1185(+)
MGRRQRRLAAAAVAAATVARTEEVNPNRAARREAALRAAAAAKERHILEESRRVTRGQLLENDELSRVKQLSLLAAEEERLSDEAFRYALALSVSDEMLMEGQRPCPQAEARQYLALAEALETKSTASCHPELVATCSEFCSNLRETDRDHLRTDGWAPSEEPQDEVFSEVIGQLPAANEEQKHWQELEEELLQEALGASLASMREVWAETLPSDTEVRARSSSVAEAFCLHDPDSEAEARESFVAESGPDGLDAWWGAESPRSVAAAAAPLAMACSSLPDLEGLVSEGLPRLDTASLANSEAALCEESLRPTVASSADLQAVVSEGYPRPSAESPPASPRSARYDESDFEWDQEDEFQILGSSGTDAPEDDWVFFTKAV